VIKKQLAIKQAPHQLWIKVPQKAPGVLYQKDLCNSHFACKDSDATGGAFLALLFQQISWILTGTVKFLHLKRVKLKMKRGKFQMKRF